MAEEIFGSFAAIEHGKTTQYHAEQVSGIKKLTTYQGSEFYSYIDARGRTHARSHVSSLSPLALLPGGNNLERSVVVLLRCWSLLGNFVPSTATLAVIARIWWSPTWHRVNDAFVGELATANKFLGKPTPIECLRVCIDRVGEDLGLGRE